MVTADFPLTMRFRRTDGSFSEAAVADDVKTARDFLAQWRHAGHSEFVIEDSAGQPVDVAKLNG
jgi:hypothetical protein